MNGWFEFGGGVSCSPSVFSPALSCQHPCSGRRAFLSLLRNPATDSFLSAVRARIPVVRLYSHNFLVPADFLSTRRVVSLSVFWCVFFLSHPVSHSPPARVPRAALISLPVCLLRVYRCGISLRHSFTRSRTRFSADSWYLKLSLISGLFHKPFMLRSSSRSPVSLPVVTRTHSLCLSILSSLSSLTHSPARLSLSCLSSLSLSRPLLSCSHLAHLSGFCAHPPVSCSPQVSHSPFLFSLHTEFLRSPPHPPAHGPVHTRLSWYSAVPLSPWRSFVLPGLSLRSRILLTPSHSHHLACSHGVSATRVRASFQRILSHGRSVLSLRRMWFTAVRFSQFSSVPFRQTAQPAGEPPAHYQSAVTRLPVSPPPSSGTDGSQPISFS